VLFVGKGRLTMLSSIDEEDFKFRYNIVSPQQIDYKIFLQSGRPEEKILAILGDFGEDTPEKVVQDIVDGIDDTADGNLEKDKYVKQLHVLILLRNLDIKLVDMLQAARFFDVKIDSFYMKGIADGEAKTEEKIKKETALKMKERGLELSLISDIMELPIEEIQKL
jgi:hypothetical protein